MEAINDDDILWDAQTGEPLIDPSAQTRQIIWALKQSNKTAYRIANETGLTVTSIAKYLKGEAIPGRMSSEVLIKYLRIDEYLADRYAWKQNNPDSEFVPYPDYLQSKGGHKIIVNKNPLRDIHRGVRPVTTEDTNEANVPGDSEGVESTPEKLILKKNLQEYESALNTAGEEIDALHALVLAQMKKIELQRSEIVRLKERIKELETRKP